MEETTWKHQEILKKKKYFTEIGCENSAWIKLSHDKLHIFIDHLSAYQFHKKISAP
jgi:hypothetical protein